MTSKEKYLSKLANRESVALTEARERIKNREWLQESQNLALRILMRLDQLSMKQKDLAKELGVSAQYVNKLLKGKEKFGWDNVVAIQRILDMPILHGYQPELERSAKSYYKVVEMEPVQEVTMIPEAVEKIQYGKIIPLFAKPEYENYEPALEM